MKNIYKLLLAILLFFVLVACDETKNIEIVENESISTEIEIGSTNVDFKSFFIIKHKDGKTITIEDSMIDASDVNLNEEGVYTLKLVYKNLEKEITIKVVNVEVTYTIEIIENLPTTFEVGTNNIDFKQYFKITDSNNNTIEVLDTMLEPNVDFDNAGTYKVKLTFEGVSKEIEIKVEESEVTYTIEVNESLPTTFEVGTKEIDFKQYFIITDSNNNTINVLDTMLESNVDFDNAGTYKVKLIFEGVSKEIEIKIEKSEVTYTIEVIENLPTTFEVGTENINFKQYFKIIDSNNNTIEVLDTMLDLTNVDTSAVGKFTVKIKFENISKEIEFSVIAKEEEENKNATDLFISEYAEGSGYNKYFEIFNGTGKAVDLSNYTIELFNNGKTPAQHTLNLSGKLKDGDVFIIYNPSADSMIKEKGNVAHKVTDFNGNDVIALYKDGVLIDVVGDINKPVDKGWTIDGIDNATLNHTLIRKSNVYGPSSTWNPSEWIVLDNEDFTNIKVHTMDGYEPIVGEDDETPGDDEKERIPDLFISEYFEGSLEYKDTKYIEIYNGLGIDVDLEAYSLAVYKNGLIAPDFVQPLSGILKDKEVYIVYAPYSVDAVKNIGNLASEVCYFNGRAAIALLKNGEVIDVIGVIGEYPDAGWDVDEYSNTANNTIIRKESINSPTSKWDATEWYACYENYLYGLGNHYQENEEVVFDNFDNIFNIMKDLELDNKGTATSETPIKVKGTVFMDVVNETTLVYLTDGRNLIKLHGDKIHNYTTPGVVYEITCYIKVYIYQPTLEVINPGEDIVRLDEEIANMDVTVKEVTLKELVEMKRENFVYNLTQGYLQSMLKVSGYLQLDTHNSSKFDYCLTMTESTSQNHTRYILNGLYFKNDVEELDKYLDDYIVIKDLENIEIEIYGVIYDWNPNRNNWRIYVSKEYTVSNLAIEEEN